MATVEIQLKTTLLTPGTLQVQEVTPVYNAVSSPLGWGAPNAARSSVDKFLISFSYPGKPGIVWETDGSSTGALATGAFQITAADLLLRGLSGCSCQIAGQPGFRSGCLRIDIRAIDSQTVSRTATTYTVRLPSALPACGSLEVKKEGQWVDVTAQGSLTNGQFQWQLLDSLDSYTDWRLKVNGIPVSGGSVLYQVTGNAPQSKTIDVTVGAGSVTLFITGSERQQWSELVASTILSELNGNCQPSPFILPFPSANCREGKLGYVGQLLDILEGIQVNPLAPGLSIDCQTGGTLLKRVQAELRELAR